MRIVTSLIAALGLTACATASIAQPATTHAEQAIPDGQSRYSEAPDISFVHGCWVQKQEPGGTITGFLRLLSEGDTYAGFLSEVRGGETQNLGRLAFAKNGSTFTITPDSGDARVFHLSDYRKHPRLPNMRTFDFTPDDRSQRGSYRIEGDGERLGIAFSEGVLSLMAFERDGCD